MPPRMVFLYGPPAVGKLTIGRLVAERLGFRLLHNHATVDAVTPVFDFGTRPFLDVLKRLRRDLIGTAAREGVDLVVTFMVVAGEESEVDALVAPYRPNVTYVQLAAGEPELRRRVADASRSAHGKITDAGVLDEILARYDFSDPLPGRAALTLDTDQLAPEAVAERIVEALS